MENKRKKVWVIVGIVVLVVFALGLLGSCIDTSDDSTTKRKGASEIYIKQCTKEFITRYYNLKYPDTFQLKTIKYYKTAYADDGYELWRTVGYFTAENAIGLEVKQNYSVYMQFKYDTDRCYALWVEVEDETYYGGKYKVDALIK